MNLVTRDGRLPKGFVLAKPIAQEGYNEAAIYELERRRRLIITRKRDGWKMFAVVGSDKKVRLFTDGLNEIDSRLDHIREEIRSLRLPSGTVLIGEAIADLDDSDDLGKVISVFHSSNDKSIKFQEVNGEVKFMIFGTIFSDARDVMPYVVSSQWTSGLLFERALSYVFTAPVLGVSYNEAKRIVVEKGWEGLVLYDKDYNLTYRTDGKAPKRPEGCYKWKPILEDDFIVREWIARPDGTVKDLVLSQLDPSSKEFYCGKLGSFSSEMRRKLSSVDYPIVVQAAFETRYPKTGKIRNARFLHIRTDKPVHQCTAPKSYPEAEYN